MLLSTFLSTFDIHTKFKPTQLQSELGGAKTITAPLVGLVKIWNLITGATRDFKVKSTILPLNLVTVLDSLLLLYLNSVTYKMRQYYQSHRVVRTIK